MSVFTRLPAFSWWGIFMCMQYANVLERRVLSPWREKREEEVHHISFLFVSQITTWFWIRRVILHDNIDESSLKDHCEFCKGSKHLSRISCYFFVFSYVSTSCLIFFLYNQLCIWIMGCALVHIPSPSKRLKGYFSSIIIYNWDYGGISQLIIHFDLYLHLRPHGSNLRSYLHVLCKEFG